MKPLRAVPAAMPLSSARASSHSAQLLHRCAARSRPLGWHLGHRALRANNGRAATRGRRAARGRAAAQLHARQRPPSTQTAAPAGTARVPGLRRRPVSTPPPVRPPLFIYGTEDTTAARDHARLYWRSAGPRRLYQRVRHRPAHDRRGSCRRQPGREHHQSVVSSSGLTFGGRTGVIIPPGALAVSDPVSQ